MPSEPLYEKVASTRASLSSVEEHEVSRVRSLLAEGRKAFEQSRNDGRYEAAWEMWTSFLLVKIVPRWSGIIGGEERRLVDDFVLSSSLRPNPWLPVAICGECLTENAANERDRSATARVAARLLVSIDLASAFEAACFDDEDDRLISVVARVPVRFANALGKKCPADLSDRDRWFALVSGALLESCGDQPEWFGKTAGRLCSAGASKALALAAVSRRAKIGPALASLDAPTIEAVATHVFASPSQHLREFIDQSFGPAIDEPCPARRFACGRLAVGQLATRSPPERAAALAVRLVRRNRALLKETLTNVFALWADKDFVREAEVARKRFVTLVAYYGLKVSEAPLPETDVVHVVKGVSAHIESTTASDRIEGMLVGEAYATLSNQQLSFEDLADADRAAADRFLCDVNDSDDGGDAETVGNSEEIQSDEEEGAAESPSLHPRHLRPRTARPRPDDVVLSGSESDESPDEERYDESDDASSSSSLEAYDLEDDGADLAPVKPPRCCRDLLELLDGKVEDDVARDRHVVAVSAAEELIRAGPADLPDVAQNLARSLLHVDNYFALEGFDENFESGLVALAAQEPVSVVANYLAPHFYKGDITVSKRLCILDVMSRAARELSGNEAKAIQQNAKPLLDKNEQRVRGRRGLVSQHDDNGTKKTRRWGYRRNPAEKIVVNRFGPYASRCFFFPLIFGYAHHSDLVESSESTFSVLLKTRLVATLSCFVECARNTPVSHGLATHLLAFAWPDARSQEPALRRAALIAFLTAISTTQDPTRQLELIASSPIAGAPSYHDILELVESTITKDPDPTVRQIAAAIGGTLPRLLV